jgi:hypothetical protein
MSAQSGQQPDRVASASVGVVALLAMLVAAAGVGVSTCLLLSRAPSAASAAPSPPRTKGALEQTPIAEAHGAADLRREQSAELSRYGWADDARQVATIPIDRAMRIVADRKP